VGSVQTLIFDLDDTLYTGASGLFAEVGERIEGWLSRALAVSAVEAKALRRQYYLAYGTTMAGLLQHHPEVDIEDYLVDAHRVDVSRYLSADLGLDAMLAGLPCTKVVFTNAIADWAERVLLQLGIRQHFSQIVDVRALAYHAKPYPEAYRRLLDLLGVSGEACVLIDDQVRNVRQASLYGMRTVLVHPGAQPGDGADFAVDDILAAGPALRLLLDGRGG